MADTQIQGVQAGPKCDWSEFARERDKGLLDSRFDLVYTTRLHAVTNNASAHSHFFFFSTHVIGPGDEEECYRQGITSRCIDMRG